MARGYNNNFTLEMQEIILSSQSHARFPEPFEAYISNLLCKLNIPKKLSGHHYLIAAVSLAAQDPYTLTNLSKALYPDIGWIYGTSGQNVERGIRYAIHYGWDNDGKAALEQTLSLVWPRSRCPANGEFISLLAAYYRY